MENLKENHLTEWMDSDMVSQPVRLGGFGIAKQTLSKYRMRGQIPYYKLNSFVRYKRTELNKWLENHKVQGDMQ